MMIEHTYFICKSSWCINIKIVAEYTKFNKTDVNRDVINVVDGIWLKFADKPIVENEIFCDDDLLYLAQGLIMVQKQIIEHSVYKETLIVINSLQFSLCDFQEEGLTAAIIEWASIAFGFSRPVIGVEFQKEINKYVFDWNAAVK
ncbi:MAG: hypothetical protein IJZ44_01880 [Lachnospiraceae bacterium]|nr:hypothetical protein [Lachnospiraceae bacterium]